MSGLTSAGSLRPTCIYSLLKVKFIFKSCTFLWSDVLLGHVRGDAVQQEGLTVSRLKRASHKGEGDGGLLRALAISYTVCCSYLYRNFFY